MATTQPPTSGGARASITVDTSALRQAVTATKAAAQEVTAATKQQQREQAAAEKQRLNEMKAALTQRRVAVRTAAREEAAAARTAAREEAAAQRQRLTELKAALAQRRVAVRAAAAEEVRVARERERQIAAAERARRGGLGAQFAGGVSRFAVGAIAPIAAGLGGAALARGSFDAARDAAFAERSAVAFDKLSGSAALAAQRLAAVQQGAAGTLSQLEAMRIGVQASALGLANTSTEFKNLASAARAVTFVSPVISDISSAISEIALAGANMSWRRLDQLGLSVTEVREKFEALKRTNSELSDNQLFSQAIIDTLNTKYAELVKTGNDSASAFERSAAAWKDARIEFGKTIEPAAAEGVNALAIALDNVNRGLRRFRRESDPVREVLREWGLLSRDALIALSYGLPAGIGAIARGAISVTTPPSQTIGARSSVGAFQRERAGVGGGGSSFTDDQTAAIRDWASGVQAIERQANNARLDATRSHERQRSEAIEQFALANAREEEDFQRSRLRAAQNLARSIARVGAEAAEREAEMVEERDKRIGKIRADAAERIAEQEADYAKERERAQRDHRDRLLDAAARLDAAAVFEEQRRFARESKDAADDHRDTMTQERKQAQERVDQENEAHEERLQDAREADAKRIEEMKESLAEAQRIEDEDRAIRKDRQAADFADQLADMDAAHAERLAQINRQAAEERQAHHDAFQQQMADLGVQNEAWKALQDAKEKASLESFDEWWEEINKRFRFQGPDPAHAQPATPAFPPFLEGYAKGGLVPRTEPALVHRGEYIIPAAQVAALMQPAMPFADQRGTQGGGVTFRGDVHVSIAGGTNMGSSEMYAVARRAFVDALNEYGGGRG